MNEPYSMFAFREWMLTTAQHNKDALVDTQEAMFAVLMDIRASLQRIAKMIDENTPAGIERRQQREALNAELAKNEGARVAVERWIGDDKPTGMSLWRTARLFVKYCGHDADVRTKTNWIKASKASAEHEPNFGPHFQRAFDEWIDRRFAGSKNGGGEEGAKA